MSQEIIPYVFRSVLPQYGYTVREAQIRLSEQMYEGLIHKRVSINEAEVGTGKSLAYLIAGFAARQRDLQTLGFAFPVTVSTASIELQRSLVQKELPRLSQMLLDYHLIKEPLVFVLRKGKEHYLCYRRYREFYDSILPHGKYRALVEQFDRMKLQLDVLTDLDSLNLRPTTKEKIAVCGSCKNCKYTENCGYTRFLHHAMVDNIDFQVTNHNLYLTSVKIQSRSGRGGILRQSRYVILDEAHKLKSAAEDTFGYGFSQKEIEGYRNAVRNLCAVDIDVGSYKKDLRILSALNRKLFQQLKQQDDLEDSHAVIRLDFSLCDLLYNIVHQMDYIEAKRIPTDPGFDQRVKLLADSVYEIADGYEQNTWIETDENGVISLLASPKNIQKILHDALWSGFASHVLTSGTMSAGKDFAFFKQENGIDLLSAGQVQESSTPSPFDYEHHTRLYIPKDIPYPDNDSKEYQTAIADRIVELVYATNGHTAILFTSYHVLQTVHELIGDRLDRFDVICMTRSNRRAILEFQKSKNAVLFASGAMWEGVDCVGDRLSSVIIVRLPFPLRSAVMEQKKESCRDVSEFVKRYALPEMIIKLRQGVGRLIRSESDTGVISILDVRATERYKRAVDEVMRKYPRVTTMGEIKAFFASVKPPEYFEGEPKS